MPCSVTSSPLRLLVLGATGVFGSRLVERLAREPGFELVLAARNRAKLAVLADSLGPPTTFRCVDRKQIGTADLAGIDGVVDAAGPFQDSGMHVIEAALAARVHYIDLADARAFVAAIPRFDAAAQAAGIAVICGASSIPALSHAVIDELTAGWREIETIKVGIFPGNRAPRGLSVVEAILSYAGQPVRVFVEGEWRLLPGWGRTHRWSIAGVGPRWASVCDTPDQDLLVQRYSPTRSAEFFAGVELSVMHLGLALLCWPVRLGLVRSLRPTARLLHRIATWLRPLGSDRGAMAVEVTGRDGAGRAARRVWTLDATGDAGPYVPVLPALAVLRRLRDRPRLPHGAATCAGLLSLGEMDADFDSLGIARAVS